MDSSKYVNTYLDFAIGMIHEMINEKLQIKTQAKLANDLVAERDQVISALKTEMENIKKADNENKKIHTDLNEALKKAKHWEDSYHGLSNKASHFDTLTNQFNDLKNQFQAKNSEIQNKNIEIQNKINEIAIKTSEFEKLKVEFNNLKAEKEEEIIKIKSERDNEIYALKKEKENLVQKVEKLESSKKQINTSRKKSISSASSANSLSVLDFVEPQKQTETNDF